MWKTWMDASTCSGLHSRRGTLSLGNSPFYSKQRASLPFVLEGDISPSLKVAHCTHILGNSQVKYCQGLAFLSVQHVGEWNTRGRMSPQNIQHFSDTTQSSLLVNFHVDKPLHWPLWLVWPTEAGTKFVQFVSCAISSRLLWTGLQAQDEAKL